MNAERASHMITGLVNAFGGHFIEINRFGSIEAPNEPGVYVIYFVTDENQKTCFPVYCGFTSRTLKIRLTEHVSREKILQMRTVGGIRTITQFSICTANGQVFVGVIPCSGMTGKMIESCFLFNFDFLLNDSENSLQRVLDPTDTVESSYVFDESEAKIIAAQEWNSAVEDSLESALSETTDLYQLIKRYRGFY